MNLQNKILGCLVNFLLIKIYVCQYFFIYNSEVTENGQSGLSTSWPGIGQFKDLEIKKCATLQTMT